MKKFKTNISLFLSFLLIFNLLYFSKEVSFVDATSQSANTQVIEKEDGQVEKSIKEVESSLDWNSIQQKATEQLGMQKKAGSPVDLDKSDNVEATKKIIEDENTNLLDKIIEYFINK